jgi:exodeoxyribonuclease-3
VKIATWNVNSIRSRLDRTLALLERHAPDVLCLQEIKVLDEGFPRGPFEAEGYHVEVFGQKTYNGVALITRDAPTSVVRGLPGDPEGEARLIAATVGGVRLIDVYVPNGQSVESPKFTFKLDWLARLLAWIREHHRPDEPLLLLGDFNIAPDERDLYDPEAFRGKVHFHPQEHEALGKLLAWGFFDVFREHHSEPGFYSWWDYRRLGFPKNKGLRIDLVLGTEPLRQHSTACDIDREERKGAKPSDHAPVIAQFDIRGPVPGPRTSDRPPSDRI